MHTVVVGAGAWGLPAAAELARRGHTVTLVDEHGPGNPLASSIGPTRLYRAGDPDPLALRLGLRAIAAMDRLAARVGEPVHRRLGLLWRDDSSLPRLTQALRAAGVDHLEVAAAEVGAHVPGLRSDGRDAVWIPEAGTVLAPLLLGAALQILRAAGGRLVRRRVTGVRETGGVAVMLAGGGRLEADAVVLAPGPGAVELLPTLGITVPLRPFVEQTIHLGDPAAPDALDGWPCLFDGPRDGTPGIYAMPSPGLGYKVGLDFPLRPLDPGDEDRTPDPARTRAIVDRVARDLPRLPANVRDAQVCSWTDSPDSRFVIDRVGSVVIACGDSGEGFKYAALMGEILADLAEGATPDADVAALSLHRLSGVGAPDVWRPTALGSH